MLWPSSHPFKIGLNGDVPVAEAELRPGIDMVGGTSLLYEIKVPAGQTPATDLAEQMMARSRVASIRTACET